MPKTSGRIFQNKTPPLCSALWGLRQTPGHNPVSLPLSLFEINKNKQINLQVKFDICVFFWRDGIKSSFFFLNAKKENKDVISSSSFHLVLLTESSQRGSACFFTPPPLTSVMLQTPSSPPPPRHRCPPIGCC